MNVKLNADDPVLASLMSGMDEGAADPTVPLDRLRDAAALQFGQAMHADVHAGENALRDALARVRPAVDSLVENMRRVATEPALSRMSDVQRADVKSAVEHQIAYVIGGYRAAFPQT